MQSLCRAIDRQGAQEFFMAARSQLTAVASKRGYHTNLILASMGDTIRSTTCRVAVSDPTDQSYLAPSTQALQFRLIFLVKMDQCPVGGERVLMEKWGMSSSQ